MVVYLWHTDSVVVLSDRQPGPDVAVEFASSRDFRIQDDNLLAGIGLVNTVEDIVRRFS